MSFAKPYLATLALWLTLSAPMSFALEVFIEDAQTLPELPVVDVIESESAVKIAGAFTTLTATLPKNWKRLPSTPSDDLLDDLYVPLAGKSGANGLRPPLLAASWRDEPDSHKIIFRIHPEATWSDGIPVTTKDVIYTLFYLSELTSGTPYQHQLINQFLTGITQYDAEHFALHYSKKYDSAPEALFGLLIMPGHAAGMAADALPPVNGPYLPADLNGTTMSLERNPDWWGDNVSALNDRFRIRKIVFHKASGERFDQFIQGQVDCISTTSKSNSADKWLKTLLKIKNITHIVSEAENPLSVLLIASGSLDQDRFTLLKEQVFSAVDGGKSDGMVADVIFSPAPTLNWASQAGYSEVPPRIFKSRIRTGFYEAAIIALPQSKIANHAEALRYLSSNDSNLHIAALYDIPYYQYACWPWVTLPQPGEEKGNILSPTDIYTGGYIGLDRRQRARILGRPDRDNDEEPIVVRYPATNNTTQPE